MTELTKYEVARIIGARAMQLARGAPPLVKPKKGESFLDLAADELHKNVIPLVVPKEPIPEE
ncbi:MAG: DNA-directed RNA polymerase subunit K [Candidatus Micrarchaeota archaeon]